jgi:hypothetical protein
MPTLAAYSAMMQRDRKREGLRVCRAARIVILAKCPRLRQSDSD